jgi:hypothetical protein
MEDVLVQIRRTHLSASILRLRLVEAARRRRTHVFGDWCRTWLVVVVCMFPVVVLDAQIVSTRGEVEIKSPSHLPGLDMTTVVYSVFVTEGGYLLPIHTCFINRLNHSRYITVICSRQTPSLCAQWAR